jgi:hypothetical protein
MGRQIVFVFLDRETKSPSPIAGFDSSNLYDSIEHQRVPAMVPDVSTPPEFVPHIHDVNVAMYVLWNSTSPEQHLAFIGEGVQVVGCVYDPDTMTMHGEPALLQNNREVLTWQRQHGIRYPVDIPNVD